MFLTLTVSANVWGATYNFSNIPTSDWKTNGGSQTINGKSWTYSSATYVACSDKAKIQIGSKKNPQTSNWTIQIPISSFGANIKVTKVAITAYTTATTATYDISVNGSSVKSGNLTTSSATYSSNTLNATTGSIVVTLKGSSNSKAMYLSDIAVTYETAAAATYKVTYMNEDGSLKSYLFQKINIHVFKNPVQIMENIDKVTTFIRDKYPNQRTLHFHHTHSRLNYFIIGGEAFWRVINYIDSVTFDVSKPVKSILTTLVQL